MTATVTNTAIRPDGTVYGNRPVIVAVVGRGFVGGGVRVQTTATTYTDPTTGAATVTNLPVNAAGEYYVWTDADGEQIPFRVSTSGTFNLDALTITVTVPPGVIAITQDALNAALAGLDGTYARQDTVPSVYQAYVTAHAGGSTSIPALLKQIGPVTGGDDFLRPNRNLVGDVSAAGIAWWKYFDVHSPQIGLQILNHAMYRGRFDQVSNSTTDAAPVGFQTLRTVPVEIWGIASFVPNRNSVSAANETGGQTAIIGCCPSAFGLGSFQLAIVPGDGKAILPSATLFTSGPSPDGSIAHQNVVYYKQIFTNADRLDTTGTTFYLIKMRVDYTTSSIVCTTPWGEVVVSDSDTTVPGRSTATGQQAPQTGQIQMWWGKNVGYQMWHPTSSTIGGVLTATDGEAVFNRVGWYAPAGPPLPVPISSTSVPALRFGAATLKDYALTDPLPAGRTAGPVDIRFRAAADLWTGNGVDGTTSASSLSQLTQTIGGIWTTTGNQRSVKLDINTSGKMKVSVSPDGTSPSAVTFTCTKAVPVSPKSSLTARAVFLVDDGTGHSTVTFYTSTSSDPLTDTWTQLGTTISKPTVTPFIPTDPSVGIFCGAADDANTANYPFRGIMYGFAMYDGVKTSGGTLLCHLKNTAGPWSTYVGTKGVYLDAAGRTWRLGPDAGLWVFPDAATASALPDPPANASTSIVSLKVPGTGTAGSFPTTSLNWTPSGNTLSIRMLVELDQYNNGTNQSFAAMYETADRCFDFGVGSDKKPYLTTSPDGAAVATQTSTAALATVDGGYVWLRMDYIPSDGSGNHIARFYTAPSAIDSPADSDYTQLGTDRSATGIRTLWTPVAGVLALMARGSAGLNPAKGRLRKFRMLDNGVEVAALDNTTQPAAPWFGYSSSAGTFTDGEGNTWTAVTGATWDFAAAAGSAAVSSFQTRTGAVTLTKADVTGTGLAASDVGAPVINDSATSTTAVYSSSKTAAAIAASAGTAGVSSFQTRTGAVSLTKADVTGTGLAAADVGATTAAAAHTDAASQVAALINDTTASTSTVYSSTKTAAAIAAAAPTVYASSQPSFTANPATSGDQLAATFPTVATPVVGQVYDIYLGGSVTVPAATSGTMSAKIKVGAQLLAVTIQASSSTASTKQWSVNAKLRIDAAGSSGSVTGHATAVAISGTSTYTGGGDSSVAAARDLSSGLAVTATLAFGTTGVSGNALNLAVATMTKTVG